MNDEQLIEEMTIHEREFEILYTNPKIVHAYNVFSDYECGIAIDSMQDANYIKATAFDIKEKKSKIMSNRSNSLAHDHDARLRWMQHRISDIFLHPMDRIESMQVLRYEKGEEYKPHCDFFNYRGGKHVTENDRVATALTYLNEDFEGGGTWFPQLNITIQPKRGSVLYWEYYASDPLTLHAGLPVESGVKFAATSWIHGRKITAEEMAKTS